MVWCNCLFCDYVSLRNDNQGSHVPARAGVLLLLSSSIIALADCSGIIALLLWWVNGWRSISGNVRRGGWWPMYFCVYSERHPCFTGDLFGFPCTQSAAELSRSVLGQKARFNVVVMTSYAPSWGKLYLLWAREMSVSNMFNIFILSLPSALPFCIDMKQGE